jgi:Domain of unknown function (DUF4278)
MINFISQANQEETAMQLSYRGNHYTVSNSTTETAETETIGLYRGHPVKLASSAPMTGNRTVRLSYRGIQY